MQGSTRVYLFEGILNAEGYVGILEDMLLPFLRNVYPDQEATFEKRDNAHPPGWLVGLEVQQKRSQKIGAFFADKSLGFSIRLNHAGVTGADWRHPNDLLLLLKIPVQAVEDTLY